MMEVLTPSARKTSTCLTFTTPDLTVRVVPAARGAVGCGRQA